MPTTAARFRYRARHRLRLRIGTVRRAERALDKAFEPRLFERVRDASGVCPDKPRRTQFDSAEVSRDDREGLADPELFEHLKHGQPRRPRRLAVVRKALAKPRLVGDVRIAIVRRVRVLFAHRGDRRDCVFFALYAYDPRDEARLADDRLPDKFALRAEVGCHPLTMRVCDFLPLCSTTPDARRASSTQ